MKLALLSATLLAGGAAAALAPAPGTPNETRLVVGILADPVTLDPHRATDLVSQEVLANVCEPLVRLRPDGVHGEAALATTWTTLDNRTWTFTLRPGVRFHDGSPLDADAVLANFRNLVQLKALRGSGERVGPLALHLTLEQPNAALLATLSQPGFCILSPRALRGEAHPPVGTGPFRLESSQPGQVELAAFDAHWGGPPRLRQLVFRRYEGEPALIEALRAGQADVSSAVGVPSAAQVRALGLTLDSRTGLNVCFLAMNHERAPFGDRRVREAISRAVDRAAILRHALGGHGEVARGPLPPLLAAAWRPASRGARELAAARRLLREAGLAEGFESTLLVSAVPRPYLPAPRVVAEQLRDDLAEVGLRLRLVEIRSWGEYVERAVRGDYDLATLGWQADTLDPNDFLSALLSSEAIPATNRTRYRSPAMDALLQRGRRVSDPAQRQAVYRQAQELFQKDVPWIPLYHVALMTVSRRDVHGLLPGPTGILRFDKAWKRD